MHVAWCIASLSLSFANVASASNSGKWCPRACELTLNYATFNDTDPWLSHKVRQCRSRLRTTSLYLCFEEFCTFDDGEVPKYIAESTEWCDEHAGVTLPSFHDVVDGWTPEDKARLPRYSAAKAVEWPVLNTAVIPDDDFFERAFTTLVGSIMPILLSLANQDQDAAFYEYDVHLVYGWYMYYFWIIVISFGIGARIVASITNLRSRDYHAVATEEYAAAKNQQGSLSIPNSWLKRYLTVPAAFGDRCSRPLGWCTIPPRAQTFTIAIFIILNIVLCCADYRLTDGNLYWPDKFDQLLRFVSDRTGIISLANFPLVWLFGMRNDLLMWLTGWGFGTYNAFHRWVARVATLQAIMHSLGYTLMIANSQSSATFDLAIQKLTQHRWWLRRSPVVLQKTLLLERRASDHCHVSTSGVLILRDSSRAL